MEIQTPLKSYLRCTAFCTAVSYDIPGLASFFKKKGYLTKTTKDMLHVSNVKRPGDLFFFNHGCFVSWGFKKAFEDKLPEFVQPFAHQTMQHIETDHFLYYYSHVTSIDTQERFHADVISLNSEEPDIKLAMSYGLAQSIKLEAFEETIQDAIRRNNYLPEEIAKNGAISLSRNAIFRRIGEIFIVRSSINLNIEYLDAPEFFWRNPNLEQYYIAVKKFLDIQSRVIVLNQKLDMLQELLDILNSQVQHRHSSLLESIIILLIVVEIIISLFQFHVV